MIFLFLHSMTSAFTSHSSPPLGNYVLSLQKAIHDTQTHHALWYFDMLLLFFFYLKCPGLSLPTEHLLFIWGLDKRSSLCAAFLCFPLKLNLVSSSNTTHHTLHCWRIISLYFLADCKVREGSCVIRKHLIHLCILTAWLVIITENARSLNRQKKRDWTESSHSGQNLLDKILDWNYSWGMWVVL